MYRIKNRRLRLGKTISIIMILKIEETIGLNVSISLMNSNFFLIYITNTSRTIIRID